MTQDMENEILSGQFGKLLNERQVCVSFSSCLQLSTPFTKILSNLGLPLLDSETTATIVICRVPFTWKCYERRRALSPSITRANFASLFPKENTS